VEGLFRVLIQIRPGYGMDGARQQIGQVIQLLHQGEEDVTIVSPDALLTTFDGVFDAMTLGVAAIGGISLLVAGLLIMNITVIGISQRTEEIGLLKALGADAVVVQRLFVLEAVLLASAGGVLGLICGQLLVLVGRQWLAVDFVAPLWAQVAGLVVAVGSGLLFACLPARRASQLLPLAALQQR
jgi:putative ABC transport system permease protein